MLRRAVECLHNLDHRGALSADGTGDGAGIMTRLPYRILERELRAHDIDVPSRMALGLFMVFLPREGEASGRRLVEDAISRERIRLLMWRPVPVGPMVLSETARAAAPIVEQAIVAAPGDVRDPEGFERRLFLARKAAEGRAVAGGLSGFAIPSASSRTVVYKGLFTAARIEGFYWDLKDPMYETDFAVFHQRYSTNTFPAWELAQPFHLLAHNGEINTIQANRSWMEARGNDLRSPLWGTRTEDLKPLVQARGSDSASLDDAFEVLVRSGRSLPHVREMLIPAAWENVSTLDPALRAFYEYHAFLTEPWDGPAAIAASDGRFVICGLDRNGLRPARWAVTPDVVLVASEAGIAPEEEIRAEATGQLGPGEVIVVNLETGNHTFSAEVKRYLASRAPYAEWIRTQTMYVQDPFDDLADDRFDGAALARVFGYTAEERRLILQQMAAGDEPILSMGNDTGLTALAAHPQRLSRFFHQAFAQVTNPPMDPIRERFMMSLRTYVGRRGSLLEETPQQAQLIELPSPVLSDAEVNQLSGSSDPAFHAEWLQTLFPAAAGPDGLLVALDELRDRAEAAVRLGATILVLSDRELDADRAPIPMTLAVGAVHHRLIDAGLRLRASIVAVSGEPRDAHDFACLIGFGASAVNPYLAIEQVRAMAVNGDVPVGPVEAQENYRRSLENGLLKIMSKMGICTISAYRGSELYEAIGLDEEVCRRAFRFVQRRVGGTPFSRIAADVLSRHSQYAEGEEEPGGYYKHRRGGPIHINAPTAVLALQKAVRTGEWNQYEKYRRLVQDEREPLELRDLLELIPLGPPVPLAEVEPADRIMRRFATAAMSMGALSKEAHETLAEAMNYIGGLSNSGEGGEDESRFGTSHSSQIKQVASGRFGVTPGYLASGEEFQIKMAQGSKPGEGGQLPGHKVSAEIARLRHTEPGVTLISPPPHHDIYSIEDLAQLIYDLKTFKPLARVSVKLVSGPGVGTIAVGVAKALADVVTISGNSGGTGASPLVSIKHAGSPWELGLAEAHQALVANGLRSTITVETDGGLRTGTDVVVAALLGASRYGFGTLPLLALGCKMVRQCHLNTCPVGIATQREDLRAKYPGTVDQVVVLFRLIAEDIRRTLAEMGVHSLEELIGRADLLVPRDPDHPVAAGFARLLVRADIGSDRSFRRIERSPLGEQLAVDGRAAFRGATPLRLAYPVGNTDRSVGTRLSGEIAEIRGNAGFDDGTISIRLSGTAGQSLGAFLTRGLTMELDGAGNDYVGKGMGGGLIVIRPELEGEGLAHGAGNACLYGATGGRLFVSGAVGQRFAVRNSGAVAVVEGTSDHCCEYMTGGVVVVVGATGSNVAAGMTGGVLFVWDPEVTAKVHFAETAPEAARPSEDDAALLQTLLAEHVRWTGSARTVTLLEDWPAAAQSFWVLRPSPPPVPAIADEAAAAEPSRIDR
jgi:glutamate synthase domain-containing protein 2/glutamate synthase domain-containing protein 1/glutamate synthase domain-containing protein 3